MFAYLTLIEHSIDIVTITGGTDIMKTGGTDNMKMVLKFD